MTWHQRLQTASFRGVPFHVDSIDIDTGRRVELIRLAGVSRVIPQELGPEARTFTFNAYVIGPNYDDHAKALEEALLAEGPGELVHPSWGTQNAIVNGKFKISESKTSGGMATFAVSFTEAQLVVRLGIVPNAPEDVRKATRRARKTLSDSFAKWFSAGALSSGEVASLRSQMTSAVRLFARAGGGLEALGTMAASLLASVRAVVESFSELVTTPEKIASETFGLMTALFVSTETAASNVANLFELDASEPEVEDDEIGGDPTELVARLDDLQTTGLEGASDINRLAFAQLLRVAAVIEAVEQLVEFRFDSYDLASTISTRLVDVFDDLELSIIDDDVFADVGALRAAITHHLALVASSLPQLREWSPSVDMPALLVAHQIYGDARREGEIRKRNRTAISHPSFVNARAKLEVLSA